MIVADNNIEINIDIYQYQEKIQRFTDNSFSFMIVNFDNGIEIISKCKLLVIFSSCLFTTLLSWDIVGDKNGWYNSLWILYSGLGIILFILSMNYYILEYLK